MHATKRTVLVVEDDAESRLLLTRQFERAGYHVLEAADGGEALRQVAQHPDTTIVLDLNLPFVDGLQVLYELWRSKRLALTARTVVASADLEIAEKVLPFRVGALLRKPYTREQLFAAVDSVAG